MSVLLCWVLRKYMDNLFWAICWYVCEIRWFHLKNISSGYYLNLAVEMSEGNNVKDGWRLQELNLPIVECGVLFICLWVDWKSSPASICHAFWMTQQGLMLCHVIAHCYDCQSDSVFQELRILVFLNTH